MTRVRERQKLCYIQTNHIRVLRDCTYATAWRSLTLLLRKHNRPPIGKGGVVSFREYCSHYGYAVKDVERILNIEII